MAKLKPIKPEDIPVVTRKQRTPQQKFEDEIRRYLEKAGFTIEGGGYFARGADIIASAEGERIIVQCKCAEKEGTPYQKVDSLKDEYSTKARKARALTAILAFKNYSIGKFSSPEIKEDILRQDKVSIWEYGKEVKYYKHMIDALGEWAKYPLLGDLGCKKEFGPQVSVPCMKAKQGSIEFGIFKISPEILMKIANVFRRIRDPKAYQRMVSKKRVKGEIREYLDGRVVPRPVFPTNLVCAFENGATFDKEHQMLTIPMKYSSAWIIDGQHRLYAFCHVSNAQKRKEFELTVAGFNISGINSSLTDSDEADIFAIINQKAKRVPPALLIDILLKTGKADWRMKVIDKLGKTDIFKNKIKTVDMPGEIDITTFVYTAPMKKLVGDEKTPGLLSKWYGRRRGLKSITRVEEKNYINHCARILEDYFSLVQKIFENEWKNPSTYMFATNRGIRALLRIAEHVLEYSHGLKNKEMAKCVLEVLEGFEFRNEKLKRMYLGEGGADELAYRWINQIKQKYPEFGPQPRVIARKEILAGRRDLAEQFITEWFPKFEGEVTGELMHIDPTTFDYLQYIPKNCGIRFIVHGINEENKCLEKARRLAQERPHLHILKVKYPHPKQPEKERAFIHERWVASENYEIEFGMPLKRQALGKSKHTITIFERLPVGRTIFAEVWDADTAKMEKLYGKGTKKEIFF